MAFLPRPPARSGLSSAVLLLAAAILLRGWQFGNPVVQIDEQFYALVGGRMLHGALPYVDLWDRKPVGLFALYAIFHLIGGPGPLPVQIAAALFAAATAWLITRMAARFAGTTAALAAGLAYLVWLDILSGDGGQSPVFYNLPVALAALLVLQAWEASKSRWLAGPGVAAMLLVGLAMQIKYTALFEGIFFGLMLLAVAHRSGRTLAQMAALAPLWIASALASTLLAFGLYLALGHGAAFATANFESIFQRSEPDPGAAYERLLTIAAIIGPLAILAGLGLRRSGHIAPRATTFVRGWVTAATLALLLFGSWYDHYALPLLVPLAIAAAPMLSDRRLAAGLLAGGMTVAAVVVHGHRASRGDGRQVEALARAIRPRLGGGTLWVFYGDPVLYDLTGSRIPTRFAFPSHLNHKKEAGALGVSRDAELARVLASRPRVIVTAAPLPDTVDPRSAAAVSAALATRYRLIASVPLGRARMLAYEALPAAQLTTQRASNRTSAGPL